MPKILNFLYADVGGELLRLYPDLGEIADQRQRVKTYEQAKVNVSKKHHQPMLARLALVLLCLVAVLATDYFRLPLNIDRVLLIAATAWGLLEFRLSRSRVPRIRAEIRSLIDAQTEYCRMCGYSLRGNTSGRCPECGTEIPADQRRLISQRNALGLEIDPGVGVE
jgi:uncharacterized paraquat-inducible protein A